ncbi:hypothetical protein PCO87_05380 [Pectobacteriaceae bacterium C52]|nr:hypothetical protein PCO87_05380 [Pectobacteriaceae bacterium C52]WJY11833.1 hypothetical protein PCO80_05355 [Pectobacteriaceae bacterium C80]
MLVTLFTVFTWSFLSDRYPAYEPLLGWSFLLSGLLSVFLLNYLFLRKSVRVAQTYQKRKSQLKTACMFYVGSPLLILFVMILFSSFSVLIILGWLDTKAAGDSFSMVLKMVGLLSALGMYLLLGVLRRNRRNFRYAISARLPARPRDSLENGNSATPPS